MNRLSSSIKNDTINPASVGKEEDIKLYFEIKESTKNIVNDFFSGPNNINVIRDVYESISELIEKQYQEQLSTSPPNSPLVCRSGCSHCCAMRVLVTPLEILQIASYIKSNYSKSEIDELIKEVEQADNVTHGLSEEEYGNTQTYCPLLVNNQCSIYQIRPFECRGYSSMDVNACKKALNSYSDWDIPIYKEQYLLFKSAHSGIMEAQLLKQGNLQLLELTSALKIALTTENIIERWLSGEHVFADAEIPESDPEIKALLPWTPTLDG